MEIESWISSIYSLLLWFWVVFPKLGTKFGFRQRGDLEVLAFRIIFPGNGEVYSEDLEDVILISWTFEYSKSEY